MTGGHRRPGSWTGWVFVVAAVICLVPAAGAWRGSQAFQRSDPGSWMVAQTSDRALFWLTCAGLSALAAGVVWAVRRWGHREESEELDAAPGGGAGAPGTSTAAARGVVVDVPSGTRLDWKAPTAPRPLHWTDRVRWALGVGWVALLLVGVVGGARVSTFDEVSSAVAAGAVRDVSVAGRLPAGGGWAQQEVTWREGLVRHRALVTASSTSGGSTGPDGAPELGRDAAAVLRDAQPALEVHRSELLRPSTATFLGWYLPAQPVLGPVLLAGTAVLLLLVLNVPPTWRLTRWAWFWIGVTPVGALLFALFAGPTPGLPRPRHPQERTGGVVAFVVSVVAGGLLHWGSR